MRFARSSLGGSLPSRLIVTGEPLGDLLLGLGNRQGRRWAATPLSPHNSWNNWATTGIRRPASAARAGIGEHRPGRSFLPHPPLREHINAISQHGKELNAVRGQHERRDVLPGG